MPNDHLVRCHLTTKHIGQILFDDGCEYGPVSDREQLVASNSGSLSRRVDQLSVLGRVAMVAPTKRNYPRISRITPI